MEWWLIYVEDLPRLPWYHHTTTYVHHIWNVYVCMWWLDTITTPQGEELGGQIRPLFLPAATFCNLLTVFFLARSTFDMLPGAALITSHRRGVRGLVDPPCHVWSLPSILFHDLPWHPPACWPPSLVLGDHQSLISGTQRPPRLPAATRVTHQPNLGNHFIRSSLRPHHHHHRLH